jgi:L-lactate utilization protein LutB
VLCSLKDFKAIYDYQGDATCAADGMCQEKCPVKINTGELIKHIRSEELKEWKRASGGAMVRCLPNCCCLALLCCEVANSPDAAVAAACAIALLHLRH